MNKQIQINPINKQQRKHKQTKTKKKAESMKHTHEKK